MFDVIYKQALEFHRRYPTTIAWRIKKHAKVVAKYVDSDEKILYTFVGQKNDCWYDVISTYIAVITDRRLILASKRVLFGSFFSSITPDLFNDVELNAGLIWGRVYIDTIGELVTFTNISKRAFPEIEEFVTNNIMREKKNFPPRENMKCSHKAR